MYVLMFALHIYFPSCVYLLLVCYAHEFHIQICSFHSHEPGPDVHSKMSEVIEGIVEDQANGEQGPEHDGVDHPGWGGDKSNVWGREEEQVCVLLTTD